MGSMDDDTRRRMQQAKAAQLKRMQEAQRKFGAHIADAIVATPPVWTGEERADVGQDPLARARQALAKLSAECEQQALGSPDVDAVQLRSWVQVQAREIELLLASVRDREYEVRAIKDYLKWLSRVGVHCGTVVPFDVAFESVQRLGRALDRALIGSAAVLVFGAGPGYPLSAQQQFPAFAASLAPGPRAVSVLNIDPAFRADLVSRDFNAVTLGTNVPISEMGKITWFWGTRCATCSNGDVLIMRQDAGWCCSTPLGPI